MGISVGCGSDGSAAQNKIDFRNSLAYISVIHSMIIEAEKLCVRNGVAVFLVENSIPDEIGGPHYKAIDRAFYGRDGNHFCHAMAMIGTMKALHDSTGTKSTERLLVGETTKKGGLFKIVDGYAIYVAFSGDCPEQHNLEIAQAGMAMLFPDEPKG